ncbi:MAG: ABC transporter permease subunit, partial [bacterium]|nr:ABC transporter permease subunit [bacterium]
LVYLAGNIPYNTWMVKTYLDTIPRSIDEAAGIDGASHFYIFRKSVMPVARPIIVLLRMTSFLKWRSSKRIKRTEENCYGSLFKDIR